MTDTPSRQRGRPTSIKQQLSDANKNLVFGLTFGLTTRQTDRLPVGHDASLTLILVFKMLNRTTGTRNITVEAIFHSFSILTLAFGQWSAYQSELSPKKEAMVRIEEDDG
jgi:hypothetical protein